MINCILPTDSLVFAELRHFVNRFQTPLPSSWIHSPIKALTRLSCCLIGRIFSQVVLLALPHIHFIQGRDVPISSQIPARHFVLFYQQACVTPPQIFDSCIICPVQRICVIPEQWSIIQTLYGKMIFFSEFFLHWVQHEVTFLWTTRGVKRNSIDYLVLLNKEDAVTILLSRPQTLPF